MVSLRELHPSMPPELQWQGHSRRIEVQYNLTNRQYWICLHTHVVISFFPIFIELNFRILLISPNRSSLPFLSGIVYTTTISCPSFLKPWDGSLIRMDLPYFYRTLYTSTPNADWPMIAIFIWNEWDERLRWRWNTVESLDRRRESIVQSMIDERLEGDKGWNERKREGEEEEGREDCSIFWATLSPRDWINGTSWDRPFFNCTKES